MIKSSFYEGYDIGLFSNDMMIHLKRLFMQGRCAHYRVSIR